MALVNMGGLTLSFDNDILSRIWDPDQSFSMLIYAAERENDKRDEKGEEAVEDVD
ncbi:hypothetical protein LguiB_001557 [Lonicera macranthoides]